MRRRHGGMPAFRNYTSHPSHKGAAYSFGKCASRPHRAALADSGMPSQCDGDMAAYLRSETLRRTRILSYPADGFFARLGEKTIDKSKINSQFTRYALFSPHT